MGTDNATGGPPRSNGKGTLDLSRTDGQTRSFPAQAEALCDIRRFILDTGARAYLAAGPLGDLIIAASEACANSVLHSESSSVEVGFHTADGRAEVVVEDGGIFRTQVPVTELGGPARGRGVALMLALMDEVSVRPGTAVQPGTRVRLVKYVA